MKFLVFIILSLLVAFSLATEKELEEENRRLKADYDKLLVSATQMEKDIQILTSQTGECNQLNLKLIGHVNKLEEKCGKLGKGSRQSPHTTEGKKPYNPHHHGEL